MAKKKIIPRRLSLDELSYIYDSAKERMDANPEVAKEYEEIIRGQTTHFKTEKEALEVAIKQTAGGDFRCQIWAKIEKGKDGIIRVLNWWLVTDDWRVKMAAEYIGMALMYDNTRLLDVIYSNVPIDDVIAYY